MKLRSGGLLFREKRSMGDFRSPGEPTMVVKGWSRDALRSLWAPFWEAFSIKHRSKFDVKFDMIFDDF